VKAFAAAMARRDRGETVMFATLPCGDAHESFVPPRNRIVNDGDNRWPAKHLAGAADESHHLTLAAERRHRYGSDDE
jgi:hypothetical protein